MPLPNSVSQVLGSFIFGEVEGKNKRYKVVCDFLIRNLNKGVRWMPRLVRGDEGRSKAAISSGELPSKL